MAERLAVAAAIVTVLGMLITTFARQASVLVTLTPNAFQVIHVITLLAFVVTVVLTLRAVRLRFAVVAAALLGNAEDGASNAKGRPVERLVEIIGADSERIAQLMNGLRSATSESEAVSRKLAIQVGETLASTARISSQTGGAKERVDQLAGQVSDGAGAMEEILAAVESLVDRIQKQDSVVDQSAAAIEQMSASIESVAAVAQNKREAAENLRKLTESGSGKVKTTETVIGAVTEGVSGINTMIEVINDIAARTNLLAMNAAIEAAHAGEAGRGFAVVAGEIRQLAENTAKNAGEISRTLQSLTTTISEAQDASVQTGAAFRSIEDGAQTVADAFAEINASTAELNLGANEVVSATESLRGISAEIVGSAQEMRIGAGEVTKVLTSTRETARTTTEAMVRIREAAAEVNLATDRINGLSVENNEKVSDLLRRIEEYRRNDDNEEREGRERLELSNVILRHMAWISRARAVIDGKASLDGFDMVDHRATDLGIWLSTDGKRVIQNPETYKRLYDTHKRLHEVVASIFSCMRTESNGCLDIEDHFEELLTASHSIVEILTGFQTGNFVRWTPAMAVNVETFDGHHQRLFALIDKLYKAMQAGESKEILGNVFDELLEYTSYHFGAEQRAFEHFAYPDCTHHVDQHRILVEKAMELRRDLDDGKALVAMEVMEFLRDWVTNHIRGCDKLYSSFFKDKDVEQFFAGAR